MAILNASLVAKAIPDVPRQDAKEVFMNLLILYTLNLKVFTNKSAELQDTFLLVYRTGQCGKKNHKLCVCFFMRDHDPQSFFSHVF